MSTKTSAEVLIGGKIYTLSGYESETYLQQVATYINTKINEFDEMENFRRMPPDMKAALLQLNIADDYFKAKGNAENLSSDLEKRDKEIYELKHDLISLRVKAEENEKEIYQLKKELNENKLLKSKLESSLEEALLGKIKGSYAASEQKKTEETTDNSEENQSKENETEPKEQIPETINLLPENKYDKKKR